MIVREAAVAGYFYPGEPDALGTAVDGYLAGARAKHRAPKALIAPHAGYVYSGPIAGTAYATLAGARGTIERVVLLGPAHRVHVRGLALSSAEAFATPLGLVPVDRESVERVRGLQGVQVLDRAHEGEHSLEVQLPFLQRVLRAFKLAPILVGDATTEQVGRVLEALWDGPETLIVVSSDLSHYHGYAEARSLDRAASDAIELLRPELLDDEQACGAHPIRGLLARARALELRATTLDLRNSGDTAGDRSQVVGYGAYVFEDGAAARLSTEHRRTLLDWALRSVRMGTEGRRLEPPERGRHAPELEALRASFVTLERDGRLRGCIGSAAARRQLIADVVTNAYEAAFSDPRFEPLDRRELDGLSVHVSVLSAPVPAPTTSERDLIAAVRPGIDGLILEDDEKRGVLLPQVWDAIPEPRQFVAALKAKAEMDPNRWSNDIRAFRFTVESFGVGDFGFG